MRALRLLQLLTTAGLPRCTCRLLLLRLLAAASSCSGSCSTDGSGTRLRATKVVVVVVAVAALQPLCDAEMQQGAVFALVIAGRPLDTNFQPVDAKKLMAVIPQPAAVHEFTIALLQPALPPDQAVAVYYSVPGLPAPFSEWQYVGSVSLSNPTAAFRAPWHSKIPVSASALQSMPRPRAWQMQLTSCLALVLVALL